MTNVIDEYQKWKQQGEDLRVQAKQAMESRFRELLAEALKLNPNFGMAHLLRAQFRENEGEVIGEVAATSKDSILSTALVALHYPVGDGDETAIDWIAGEF